MKRIKSLLMLLVLVVAFGCKPDPLEYARPDNLVGTIYSQLEGLGEFNYYLQAIDGSQYKEPLIKGGSWTIFAPTDEAFEKFMTEEGYATFDAIPEERIDKIIKTSIIIDVWNTTTLTYYNRGFYEGNSFKRYTQYQDPVVEVDAADFGELYEDIEPGKYLIDTSNGDLKTTTYFLDSYFDVKPATETSDYDFMFPGESFTTGGMRVFESDVTQTNIVAENGMIYALDKVLEPRINLYQNLSAEEYEGKYSMFKRILERFGRIRFIGDEENPETGEIESIYRLEFLADITQNLLSFNPNEESYPRLKSAVDRTLADATGLLVPTNEALENYLNGDSVLGQFYDSYDDMPLDVLGNFLKPFFFVNFYDICPSNFGQSYNVGQNLINFQEQDVVDRKMCSNGFFVGVNEVYTNNNFASVLGPLLLDPDYTLMLRAIQGLRIDNALQSTGIDFSVFGIRNDQFIQVADPNSAFRKITILGVDEDTQVAYMLVEGDPVAANNRIYPDPSSLTPSSADLSYVRTTLESIVLNQIVEEAVDFNSDNYYPTKSGEFIFATGGGSVLGGGNISSGISANVVEEKPASNGVFYEMSTFIERPLKFTYGALVDNSSQFEMFVSVLVGADALIDIPSYEQDKLLNFINLQKSFTLLAPNNSAVLQAIADGVIPSPDPDYLATLEPLDLAIAKKELLDFAKRHFIQQAIPTDGSTAGTYNSLYFGEIIDFAPVYDELTVENSHSSSSLTVTNGNTGEVITTSGITNLLSRKVVIHEIGNYIK